jgi:peptidoglycan hydrolase CwlO-like protein
MRLVKEYWHVITIAVLLIILIVTIVTKPNPADAIKEYKLQRKVDSLNVVIQSYESERNAFRLKIDSLDQSISIFQDSISNQESIIDDLQEDYNEAVNNISKFTTNDITKFLSDRYGN